MAKGTILIRADATVPMGTGHVMRCLALAQNWHDAGGKVVFVMAEYTMAISERLMAEGYEVCKLDVIAGSQNDAERFLDVASMRKACWAVIDGYQFRADYHRKVKSGPLKCMILDDNGETEEYVTDLVVNPNIHADAAMYRLREPNTRLLLGTRFAMLRREFNPWKKWERQIVPLGRKILVTMGGSDPENVTEKIIRILGTIAIEGMEVVSVAGGSNPHLDSLRAAISERSGRFSLRTQVDDMPDLMAWADLAISAAGSTCWEMCLLGLPAIIIPVAENQIASSIRLGEAGAAYTLNSSLLVENLARVVQELIASSDARLAMSEAGRRTVDGDGASRVVQAILEMSVEGEPIHVWNA